VFYDGVYLRQLMEKLHPEQDPWDREHRIITLLSATPHNGDRYAFHALLTLLDEYSFPDLDSVTQAQVARVAIRRTKREILDEQGTPVFVERHVQTLPVEFSPAGKSCTGLPQHTSPRGTTWPGPRRTRQPAF